MNGGVRRTVLVASLATLLMAPSGCSSNAESETNSQIGNDSLLSSPGTSRNRIPMPSFLELLGKRRQGSEIRRAQEGLGRFEKLIHHEGIEICFRELGIHFVFDKLDLLDKIIFYGDSPDPHQPFSRRFPLAVKLSFDQTREEAGKEVDNQAGGHVDAELGKGEWDKYEMQGYRLYLRFGQVNGKELIREIQLVRPKNELADR